MKRHPHKKVPLFLLAGIVIVLCLLIPLIPAQSRPFKADVRHISVEQTDIAYYTRGAGEPLILLGGFGMTMQDWDPLLLEKLSHTHMLIIIDYPATGASNGKVFPEDEQALAKVVVGVMDELEIKNASLLGWSLGSFVGQVVAAQYPDRIDKLILIATGPGGTEMIGATAEVSTAIDKNVGGSWETAYVPYLFPENAATAKEAYLARRKTALANGEAPQTPKTDLQTLLSMERVFADTEQEALRYELLKEIEAPTLILAGDQDILLPIENNMRTAEQIPHAKLITIPNAGHAVLFQEVTRVTEEIEHFLKS